MSARYRRMVPSRFPDVPRIWTISQRLEIACGAVNTVSWMEKPSTRYTPVLWAILRTGTPFKAYLQIATQRLWEPTANGPEPSLILAIPFSSSKMSFIKFLSPLPEHTRSTIPRAEAYRTDAAKALPSLENVSITSLGPES